MIALYQFYPQLQEHSYGSKALENLALPPQGIFVHFTNLYYAIWLLKVLYLHFPVKILRTALRKRLSRPFHPTSHSSRNPTTSSQSFLRVMLLRLQSASLQRCEYSSSYFSSVFQLYTPYFGSPQQFTTHASLIRPSRARHTHLNTAMPKPPQNQRPSTT
jgi:hypothetical protein